MTIAEGTRRATCHHNPAGPRCGECIGADTRAAAAAAGMPVAYFLRTQVQGWSWARFRTAVHLVHPNHDRAECGRFLPRGARTPVTSGIAEAACAVCWRRVLGDTPRRSR